MDMPQFEFLILVNKININGYRLLFSLTKLNPASRNVGNSKVKDLFFWPTVKVYSEKSKCSSFNFSIELTNRFRSLSLRVNNA